MAEQFTQENRAIAITTPLGDDVLLLKAFTLSEELGRPFKCICELRSINHNISYKDIVGQEVSIRLLLEDGTMRYLFGVVSQFGHEGTLAAGRMNHYTAVVVPALWFLTQTADCRIFQNKSARDIVMTVLGDCAGLTVENRLQGSYPVREYVVQYRESTFDFASRLMEEEGIFYYFEHTEMGATMVLADDPAVHLEVPGLKEVEFREQDDGTSGEHINEVTRTQRVVPGEFVLRDYDFKVPTKLLESKEQTGLQQHTMSFLESYDYPGHYTEKSDGDRYAKLRREEADARHEMLRFSADVRGLCIGCKFKLAKYPFDALNASYVIVAQTCRATSEEFGASGEAAVNHEPPYRTTFAALPATTPFRSSPITPRPRISGPQTAFVTGPEGEDIYVDEFGRVKVQFLWDREGQGNENSSCYVRVSQGWAGKRYGMVFLPRIGNEVIVDFLEGNPDRPIITGRVYNGGTEGKIPYKLPDAKTVSTIKSCTSKTGSGFNEIRFEDKAGSEQFFIHAQKSYDMRVLGTAKETIYGNREVRVGWESSTDSGGSLNQLVKLDENTHTKGGRFDFVEKVVNHAVTEDVVEDFQKNQTTFIKEALTVNAKKAVVETQELLSLKSGAVKMQGTQSLDIKAAALKIAGDNSFDAKGATINIEGAQTVNIKGGMNVNIEGSTGVSLKCGGNAIVLDPSGVSIQGTMVKINMGAAGQPATAAAEAASAEAATEGSFQDPIDAAVASDQPPGERARYTGTGQPRVRTARTLSPQHAPPPPPRPRPPRPPGPEPVPPPQATSDQPCGIHSLRGKCAHRVSGREREANNTNGRLQIVCQSGPQRSISQNWGGTSVSLRVTTEGTDRISGFVEVNEPAQATRKEVILVRGEGSPPSSGWQTSGSGLDVQAPSNDDLFPYSAGAELYTLYGRGCDDTTQQIIIESFPSQQYEAGVSLDRFEEMAEAIGDFLTETVFGPMAATTPARPSLEVTLPTGNITGKWGWTEDQDWRVFYGVEVTIGLTPLIGLTFQLDVSLVEVAACFVAIPPSVSSIITEYGADIFFRVQIGAQIGASMGPRCKFYTDGSQVISGVATASGQIPVLIGLGGRVGSMDVLGAEIVGACRSGVGGQLELEISGQGATVQPSFEILAGEMLFTLELRAGLLHSTSEMSTRLWERAQVYPNANTPSDPIRLFPR